MSAKSKLKKALLDRQAPPFSVHEDSRGVFHIIDSRNDGYFCFYDKELADCLKDHLNELVSEEDDFVSVPTEEELDAILDEMTEEELEPVRRIFLKARGSAFRKSKRPKKVEGGAR